MTLIDDVRVDIGDDGGIVPSGSISSLHNLLSSTHPDTVPSTPTRDTLIVANQAVTPQWGTLASGLEGEVLTVYQGRVRWASARAAILTWGNNRIGSSTTVRYLTPYFDGVLASTSPMQYIVPRDGILKKINVIHNTPNGNGNSIVYTLRKNSVLTSLSVSLSSTAASGSNSTNNVPVSEGDILDIEVTKASAIGNSPRDIIISMEFV